MSWGTKIMKSKLIIASVLIFTLVFISSGLEAKKKITRPSERATYHNNQGISYLNKGDMDRAEFEFKTAIELSPDYIESYNNLGIIYKLKGNKKEAIKNLQKAISLDKDYATAYSHLGAIYLSQGKIDDAISTIKKGLKKDGRIADARY
ncbi:MAG: hypothetical protein COS89_05130, partial [Deltaproteobacteria bacterium CG07_land_8_20_14_0_80_38_7]